MQSQKRLLQARRQFARRIVNFQVKLGSWMPILHLLHERRPTLQHVSRWNAFLSTAITTVTNPLSLESCMPYTYILSIIFINSIADRRTGPWARRGQAITTPRSSRVARERRVPWLDRKLRPPSNDFGTIGIMDYPVDLVMPSLVEDEGLVGLRHEKLPPIHLQFFVPRLSDKPQDPIVDTLKHIQTLPFPALSPTNSFLTGLSHPVLDLPATSDADTPFSFWKRALDRHPEQQVLCNVL